MKSSDVHRAQQNTIDQDELARALADFEPVWRVSINWESWRY